MLYIPQFSVCTIVAIKHGGGLINEVTRCLWKCLSIAMFYVLFNARNIEICNIENRKTYDIIYLPDNVNKCDISWQRHNLVIMCDVLRYLAIYRIVMRQLEPIVKNETWISYA